MIIRDEKPGDEDAIGAVTAAAFAGKAYSDQTEPLIIEHLRAAGALVLSLVAEENGAVIGHIGFSPVTVSNGEGGWYGLGPVSVSPDRQKSGIGLALIREGIDRLRQTGAEGIVLAGSPDYYNRFGFSQITSLQAGGIPPQYFLGLPLRDKTPSGMVTFHPAFFGTAA